MDDGRRRDVRWSGCRGAQGSGETFCYLVEVEKVDFTKALERCFSWLNSNWAIKILLNGKTNFALFHRQIIVLDRNVSTIFYELNFYQ